MDLKRELKAAVIGAEIAGRYPFSPTNTNTIANSYGTYSKTYCCNP